MSDFDFNPTTGLFDLVDPTSIGSSVVGADPNRVLFTDASSNLAQSNNLTYISESLGVGRTFPLDSASFNILEFGQDDAFNFSGLPFRLYYNGAYQVQFDDGTGNLLDFATGQLSAQLVTISSALYLLTVAANRALYTGASGLVTSSANFTFDGNKLSLAGATSVANGFRLGADVDLYRSAADELRTPDGFVADTYSAIATTRDSRYSLKLAKTCSTNSSDMSIRADTSITGAITSAFPGAGNFSTSVNAGANTLSFSVGVFFSNRSELTQSGTQTEQWGVYGDAWHRSQGNVGTLGAGRGFVNIVAGSAGTITTATTWQGVLTTNSGGTNANITTASLLDVYYSHSGSGTIGSAYGLNFNAYFTAGAGAITTMAGTRVNNPGSGVTITSLYGHYIADLTRGTTNRAIYIAGSGVNNAIAFNAGSALLYSGAADRVELGTGDSFYIPNGINGLAVGTTPSTSLTASILRTTTSAVVAQDYALHAQMTVAHGNAANFPGAFRARADVSAGANTVLYHAAVQGLCQVTNSHSGTVSNAYGADYSVRWNTQQATAVGSILVGGNFAVTADATTSQGTIGTIYGGQFAGGLPAATTGVTISSLIAAGRFVVTVPTSGASGATAATLELNNHTVGSGGSAISVATHMRIAPLTANYTSGTKYPILFNGTNTSANEVGIWWGTDANNVSISRVANDTLGLGLGDSLQLTAGNIITDTKTGTKIGTATTQKLAFFNSTPIVQPGTYTITAAPAVSTALNADANGGAYTGIDNAQVGAVYAQLASLNDLRADVESISAVLRQLIKHLGDTSGLGLVNETSY